MRCTKKKKGKHSSKVLDGLLESSTIDKLHFLQQGNNKSSKNKKKERKGEEKRDNNLSK